MRDLLVLTPSRGRPDRLARMLSACLELSEVATDVAIAVDTDDPNLESYRAATSMLRRSMRVRWHEGPRDSLSSWTNRLATLYAGEHRALASFGDDHVPRTAGWDTKLLTALDAFDGIGIAYGDDLHQGHRLPTAPVMSSQIVEALGWFCEPSMSHMFVDDVWRDLGAGADCLAYVPDVVIEHLHPDAGKTSPDAVYAESAGRIWADRAAYDAWRRDRMAHDVATVAALRSSAAA